MGLILGGVEDKMSNRLMFMDIMVAGRGLNVLIDTGVSDLFMSKETARKLDIEIQNESG